MDCIGNAAVGVLVRGSRHQVILEDRKERCPFLRMLLDNLALPTSARIPVMKEMSIVKMQFRQEV